MHGNDRDGEGGDQLIRLRYDRRHLVREEPNLPAKPKRSINGNQPGFQLSQSISSGKRNLFLLSRTRDWRTAIPLEQHSDN